MGTIEIFLKRVILTGLPIVLLGILSIQYGSSDASRTRVHTVSPHCSKTRHGGVAIAKSCHELSFYVKHAHKYFKSNTIFRFLSGRHVLHASQPVTIADKENIHFIGLHDGKDVVPIIHCTEGTRGFVFKKTSGINIESLMFDGCGGPKIKHSALTVIKGNSVKLTHVTIKNTIGMGLELQQVHKLEIISSSFINNGLGVRDCTSDWWLSSYSVSITATHIPHVKYTITDSIFAATNTLTNHNDQHFGGGLYIYSSYLSSSSSITLKGSTFKGIKSCSAAATIATTQTTVKCSVVVTNSKFIGTHSQWYKGRGGNMPASGALTIHMSHLHQFRHKAHYDITIQSTDFLNNTGSIIGGAFISTTWDFGIHERIFISDSKFIGNTATNKNDLSHQDSTASGITIEQGATTTKHLEIKNCVFKENTSPYAAVLNIKPKVQGLRNNVYITIDNCLFLHNRAAHPGIAEYKNTNPGIIRIGINKYGIWTQAVESTTVQLTISRCHIVGNRNEDGYAALHISSTGNYKTISNNYKVYIDVNQCFFSNNSAIGLISEVGNDYFHMKLSNSAFIGHSNNAIRIFDQMTHLYSLSEPTFYIQINNLTVASTKPSTNNDTSLVDRQSAIYTECSSRLAIVWMSNIHMHNNRVSPILNINCGLSMEKDNVIENNIAKYGGAIQIRGIGYAFMNHRTSTSLIIQNNRATYGGALYSQSQEYISPNSMCTFLSLRYATFHNNSATIAGDNVYGGVLKDCKYKYHFGHNVYDYNSTNHSLPFVHCGVLDSSENTLDHGMFQASNSVSSNPFSVLSCNDNHSTMTEKNVTIYPGEAITLSVMTAGYCNSFSPGFLNITTPTKGIQIMEEDIKGQQVDVPCKEIHFKPLTESIVNGTILVDVAQMVFSTTAPLRVNVQFLSCPHGMFLDSTRAVCQCNDSIADYMDQCNISHVPNPFHKKASNRIKWITYNKEQHCIVVAPICPRDYCSLNDVYFNLDNTTDYQCNHNRTGTLCGQCQPGLSLMLGSNACGRCSNQYLLLLLVFVIAGLVLGAVITFLNLTVSMGMLSGLLFYANIVKLNEALLFPNGDILVISQFISWLNLDFGIEVCFFNGLDDYWKTWLQFAFPLYVCSVTMGIIVCSKYSIKLSRRLPTNIIPVLATLILISLTKLLRTVTAVFMATRLRCGTHTELVWSIDGSIEYWSIKHFLLMGFSALVLVFVAGYSFLLLFSRCLHRASNYKLCCCLRYIIIRIDPFIDAYTGPLVPKYGYWAGVLVLIRIIVTILFMYTSGSITYINNYIIVSIQVVIFNVFSSSYYQSKINYLSEKFFHVNLCVLCIANSFCYQNSTGVRYITMATIISVSASIVVFIAIFLWQIYQKIIAKVIRAVACCGQGDDDPRQPLLQHIKDREGNIPPRCYSPQPTPIRRRDSIIYDLN